MAFKLTRPIIQGSPAQKASAVKARVPTVAGTRTQADPALIYAGAELGKSYIPGAIDYTINGLKELTYRDDMSKNTKDLDTKENGDGILGCTDSTASNYSETATKDDGSCEYIKEEISGCTDSTASNYNASATVDDGSCVTSEPFTVTEFQGNAGDPYSYRTTESGGYQYKCPTCNPPINDWVDATNQGAIDAISEHDPSQQESAVQLRNRRIYRNAVPGGKIQTKLINDGFDPYK